MTATTDVMSPKPRRRWYQLTLPTLLGLVAVCAVILTVWTKLVHPHVRQYQTIAAIKELGADVRTKAVGPLWLRRLLGEQNFLRVVEVDLETSQHPLAVLEQLDGLMSLEELDLGQEIGDDHLRHVRAWSNLDELDLSGSRVTDAGMNYVGMLERLEKLYLRETQIGNAGVKQLRGLTRLKHLHLGETQITNDGLQHLGQLTNLESLDLMDTRITDEGLEHLYGLRKLESLALDRTQVTEAGVSKLKRSLPHCQVAH